MHTHCTWLHQDSGFALTTVEDPSSLGSELYFIFRSLALVLGLGTRAEQPLCTAESCSRTIPPWLST